MKTLWLSTLISWGITLAGFLMAAGIRLRVFEAPGGLTRHWGVMLAASVSLALTAAALYIPAGKSRLTVVGLFLGAAGFLFLLVIAHFTMVSVSGQRHVNSGYAMLSIAAALVLAFIIFAAAAHWGKQAAWFFVLAQLAVISAALAAGGGLGHLRLIDHWAEPVSVTRLALRGGVSPPLVEEIHAFVLDKEGILYRIDLGEVLIEEVGAVPRPEPAEAGFPHLVKAPRWADTLEGQISRAGPSTMIVRYPYVLAEIGPGGKPVTAGRWTLEALIELPAGEAAWRLLEEDFAFEGHRLGPVRRDGYTLTMGAIQLRELTVEGPGVKTVIWQKEEMHWLASAPGRFLAATRNGTLYIIALNN